jgi:cbb3-type cytochrome oxidase subunit 3
LATEYVQFVGALVLFLGILLGSYWFVYVPGASRRTSNRESRPGSGE